MRHKIPEDKKKSKFSICLNEKLDNKLEQYLAENNIPRSKYIEKLIRDDFEKKGYDITPDFEK